MDRRAFFRRLTAVGVLGSVGDPEGFSRVLRMFDDDETICSRKFELAVSLSLRKQPINEVIVAMGKSFIGTDYVAHALEVPGEERLIVNMRALDCVSFYENAVVLARCVKLNRMTFEEYKKQLQLVRYRGGIIAGYPSRLHYTSDYFHDNEAKGVWRNVTKDLGGVPYVKTINFMSTHPESYRQLKENPSFVEEIQDQEERITKRETYYLPKEKIGGVENGIQEGDVLGITTNIPGLDVSHTGIAVRSDGRVRLMHAPIVGKKVEIMASPLADYLSGNKQQTGIMIVRTNEP